MQALISVDHESRHSSYRADSEAGPTEETALLQGRFPATEPGAGRDFLTSAVVTVLLVVLASGVVIGVYLLIQQSDAENVLPPVEEALQLVSRSQWTRAVTPPLTADVRPARRVVALQTDSDCCWATPDCVQLLLTMQNQLERELLPYNFVISSDGQTFEVLGWRRRTSPLADSAHSLVLAFIGNFSETPPSARQMKAAKIFLDESVSHKYLESTFDIVGRETKYSSRLLFQRLKEFKQWNSHTQFPN